jgi:hypothetical protein
MPLNNHEDCKDKSKVFAELKKGHGDRAAAWTEAKFSFTAPADHWLSGTRPPYKVRWYSPDSPQTKGPNHTKLANTVYLEAIDVPTGKQTDTRLGTIS